MKHKNLASIKTLKYFSTMISFNILVTVNTMILIIFILNYNSYYKKIHMTL